MILWRWFKRFMDPDALGSRNGVSLSRRLLTLWIVVLSFAIVWDVLKRGITAPTSVIATGIAASLAGIWGASKFAGGPPEAHP